MNQTSNVVKTVQQGFKLCLVNNVAVVFRKVLRGLQGNAFVLPLLFWPEEPSRTLTSWLEWYHIYMRGSSLATAIISCLRRTTFCTSIIPKSRKFVSVFCWVVFVSQITSSTKPQSRQHPNTSNYIGMTENDFKTRFNNHNLSFRIRNHTHDTTFKIHLGTKGQRHNNIKWRIIKRANAYKGNPSRCNLCLSEKLCILTGRDTLLNTRSELVIKCRHENKFFATNHRTRCSKRPWISNFHLKTEICFQNF